MASPQVDDVSSRHSLITVKVDNTHRTAKDDLATSSLGRKDSGIGYGECPSTTSKPNVPGRDEANTSLCSSNSGHIVRGNSNGTPSNDSKVPDIPNALSPASSAGLTRTNSIKKEVVTILFSNPNTQEEDIIQSRLTCLMPRHSLEELTKLGECMTQGDRKIVDMGSNFGHTATRLKQFLERKSYVPFGPRIQLQVVGPKDTPLDWPVRGLESKRSTEETLSLFYSELSMYKHASLIKYDEIRIYSSKNIRTGYPIYKEEVIALLERIYEIASKNKDVEMIDFITDATHKHADELISTPAIRHILQSSINEDSAGHLLLDMVLKTTSQAQANLFLDSALSPAPSKARDLPIPTSPSASTKSLVKPAVVAQQTSDAAYLRKFHEFIVNDRILVAQSDGYGTLINGPPGSYQRRNRDFKFEHAELLLADFEQASTRHNVTVVNGRGQKGDILASFVVKLDAAALGLDGRFIHVGSAESYDREQRMFRPGISRGRSRSPERR
ncbi:hypothetical protein EJ05DRAFT_485093 [Pseudovirgaria hyperparasitica]|uniref:Uncharacterized protein n=1 Tax=Pseudovirgaria hyperparasitica TaxID=470096 RepID=A0A6A6W8M6_9PEZI|nr:uncharacterized protein EJ05DRAFT_485093 [Pseudovirgaria hyperparasitica]KAF2759013.1 hypothetical protein EJ05DRAFT_485093 [Pseudovirgaria hyperparasitica]